MLEVRDVTKRYGALVAVNHVSFTVKPGEVLGYLGPNGSGKSTTVKMLVGLMPPTNGHIFFNGADIQENLLDYKAQVGYVPEEAHVYTYLTGPEYLRFVGRLRGMDGTKLESKIDRFLHIFSLDSDYHAPLAAYGRVWGADVAVTHALVCLTLGATLTEALLWGSDELPCSRPWRPEHANLRTRWPAYLLALFVITVIIPAIERQVFGSLTAELVFVGTFAALGVILRFTHRRRRLLPDDDPDEPDAVQLLNLN
jgi:ABC-type dipeptide/oligopeptide/nickel transport system ATPase component